MLRLSDAIDDNPDLTFGEILVKLGVVESDIIYGEFGSVETWTDESNLESADLLARVEEKSK